nr:protease pro-enzyme activation domain-containing protein [uncultured Holophaga sp.]
MTLARSMTLSQCLGLLFACGGLAFPVRAGEARTLLSGTVSSRLQGLQPVAEAPDALVLDGMTLCLKRSEASQAALETFLTELQDPKSANYHQWLSPEAFGQRFGASQEDLDAVTAWLVSQGFSVDSISPGRMSISFSGTKATIEKAFQTRLMYYEVDGTLRHANASSVSIPSALADKVAGPLPLTDIPHLKAHKPRLVKQVDPAYTTSGGSHYLGPGDFAVIYDTASLLSAGTTGSGVSIAIAGRSNITASDVSTFRTYFGLPTKQPTVTLVNTDPGIADDADEALLDVTWAGAVATQANIKLVIASSTSSMDGVDLACQYIVQHNSAPILSLSYGSCESDMTGSTSSGSTYNTWYQNLWSQAAAEGITVCVSTGDSGAAGCDSGSDSTGSGAAINGLASTPYNVAVGGTQFSEGTGSYWDTSNSSTYTSALSYIPEVPWNESAYATGTTSDGLWATGGGSSIIWSKPSWQVVTGDLSSGMRDIPDVSLSAAGHDGYLVYDSNYGSGTWYVFSGTSASAPSFAGIMALIVQTYGNQGNANEVLYPLGRTQYNSGSLSVFHDVTTGDNTVTGVTGFSACTGYDRATGLGSVDAAALVSKWESASSTTPPSITSQPASVTASSGSTATFSVTASGTGTLSYQWQVSTDSGATWASVADGTGGTTSSYTTATLGTAENGCLYRVKVTDTYGTSTSSTALLTVTDSSSSVGITASTSAAAAVLGKTLTLSATVTGSTNTGVTWAATGGTLSATSGSSVVWTAPSTAGSYTVTATSQADTSKTSTLTLAAKTLNLNSDSVTGDVLDLALMARAYGTSEGGTNWVSGADLNGDASVDETDLNTFLDLAGF